MKRRMVVLVWVSLSLLFGAVGAAFALDLTGTLENDRLLGTSGADILIGLAGDDKLIGLGGKDEISGGDGRDAVLGSGEEFLLIGASKLSGGRGGDFVGGTIGRDRLDGGSGNDYIFAGPKSEEAKDADTVSGGGGKDAIFAKNVPAARDSIKCGSGRDIVLVDEKDVTTGCEKVVTSTSKFYDAVPDSYFEPLYNR